MTIRASTHQRDIEDALGELLTEETLVADNIVTTSATKVLVTKTANNFLAR